MPKAPQDQDIVDGRASTALDDPGTTQAFLFLGWIPPAVAAVVGGVIVAAATGNLGALLVVALGGTIVGYVAGLVVLFAGGGFLAGRVGERVANGFLVFVVAVSVAAALAVAVSASGVEFDPALVKSGESVLGLGVIVIIVIMTVIAFRGRRRS